MQRLHWRKTRLAIAVTLAVGLVSADTSANAFHVPEQRTGGIRIYYQIDATAFALDGGRTDRVIGAVHLADNSWRVHNVAANADFYDSNQNDANRRRIYGESVDGPGVAVAGVVTDGPNNIGCKNNASYCRLALEPNNFHPTQPWNWGPDNPGVLDPWGYVTHEFGHWFGLDHSTDRPISDGGANPTMEPAPSVGGGEQWRTVQADDVSAMRAARRTQATAEAQGLAANGNFEAGLDHPDPAVRQPEWGGAYNTGWYHLGGQWVDQNCWTAWEGSCFMAYPAGTSLFQDIAVWSGNWINGATMSPRARLRAPFVDGMAEIAVWRVGVPGQADQKIYSKTCRLPVGVWVDALDSTPNDANGGCTGPWGFNDPAASTWIRLEIYNNSNTNLDVDAVGLYF
jgi:hypothetical protein